MTSIIGSYYKPAPNGFVQTKPVQTPCTVKVDIGPTEENSRRNSFIKAYIEKKATASNIKIPDSVAIVVTTPKEFSKEYKNLLHDVRTNIYKARVGDMFKLLEQDKETVQKRVEQMKISQQDKEKIFALKEMFDSYYKIEIKHDGKKINILNPSEAEKQELEKISPDFANFIIKEQKNLNKITTNFTRDEIKAEELSAAGHSSRVAAGILLAVLLFNVGKAVWASRANKVSAKDLQKFLADQKEIYEKGAPKFVNPIKAFKEAGENCKMGNWKAIIGLALTTLSGGLDDLLGGVKDAFQDCNNFGKVTGIAFAIPSAIIGLATSALIAPTVEKHIEYKIAEKALVKHNVIKKTKGLGKILKTAPLAALIGVVIAVTSSGSSWSSMALTRWWMGKKGDELADKNIIDKKDNTFKNTNKNMMAYEAYEGKWSGISKGDPAIGAIGGGLGLFTHTNPYIQSLSFGLQGCSETITACLYQLTGNKVRNDKLADQKQKLLNSLQ